MHPEPEKTDSTYAELVERLKRATDIEQALMAQYLYAAFAIRPKYESLRGLGGISGHYNLLGVAIEEMRHLHQGYCKVGLTAQNQIQPFKRIGTVPSSCRC